MQRRNVSDEQYSVVPDSYTIARVVRDVKSYLKSNKRDADIIKVKAMVAFIYLTACRVSEMVGHREYVIEEDIKVEKWHNTIQKQDIEFIEQDGKPFALIHNVVILKRRKAIELHRTIPINLEREKELWAYVQAYLDTLPYPEMYLFKMERTTAYKKIRFGTGYWPHYFRHARITNLVKEYGFDVIGLVNFTGWAKPEMAMEYAHIRPTDLMRKMI